MASAARIDLTNQFLIAMPGMADDNFAGSVVYLCEHNERGALGLVINKPIDIKLKNLFEKVDLTLDRDELAEQPVYYGGPVQTERGFVLHESQGGDGASYSSTMAIPGGLEMTTSKDVLEALAQGAGPKKLLVTLGYSGWQAGQLEDETRPQRLAHGRRRPGDHLRHPGRAALGPRARAARLRPAHALARRGPRMSRTCDRACARANACEWAPRPRGARPARVSRTCDRACARANACEWAPRLAARVLQA